MFSREAAKEPVCDLDLAGRLFKFCRSLFGTPLPKPGGRDLTSWLARRLGSVYRLVARIQKTLRAARISKLPASIKARASGKQAPVPGLLLPNSPGCHWRRLAVLGL